jgi:hypothetical protein
VPPLPEPQHDADDHRGAPPAVSAPGAAGTSSALPTVTVARPPSGGPPPTAPPTAEGERRGGRRRRLAALAAVVAVVLIAGALAAWQLSGGDDDDGLDPVVADDFSGAAVDLAIWEVQTPNEAESRATVEPLDGRLVITSNGDPKPTRGGLTLTCSVQDFDVRVAVELLEWPDGSGGRVGFEVQGANTSFARADVGGDTGKLSYDTYDFDLADPKSNLVLADVDALDLELRMVRLGGTTTGYWRPAGSVEWQQVASGAVADTAPAVISISLWGAYNQTIQAAFDDFELFTPNEPCA